MTQTKNDRYTYDGNDEETYTIFRDGKEVGKLAISEDEAIDAVAALNAWRKNFDSTPKEKWYAAMDRQGGKYDKREDETKEDVFRAMEGGTDGG